MSYSHILPLSAKTSLMLGVHKAGFRREGHIILFNVQIKSNGYYYGSTLNTNNIITMSILENS